MKVIAIESVKDGHMRYFGEGVHIGDQIPDLNPFNEYKIKNPCIRLDNGKFVWGLQCWWGDTEKARAKFNPTSEEIVEFEEIKPLYPITNNEDGKTT